MRHRIIQFGAVLILAVSIGGHVSEIFDHWDNTFQTGHDIDYATVIVALIAGAAFGLARVAAIALHTLSATFYLLPLIVVCRASTPSPAASTVHSPPQPLRI